MRNLSYFYNLPWGNLIAKIWGILLSTYIWRVITWILFYYCSHRWWQNTIIYGMGIGSCPEI